MDEVTLTKVKSMLSGCSVSFSPWFGISKGFEYGEKTTAADSLGATPESISASKKIIDTKHPAYQAITSIKNYCKSYWLENTYPYVQEGVRLFLIENREKFIKGFEDYKSQLKDAVVKLDKAKEELISTARKALGRLFDESLYPKSFVSSFGIGFNEINIEPPSYLMHTNAEEYKKELARGLVNIQQSMEIFERNTFQQMGVVANTLMRGLSGEGNISKTTVGNFQEIFSKVSAMKFEGTAAFKACMEEAKKIITGVDVIELRKDGGAKEETKEKLKTLISRYQQLQKEISEKNKLEIVYE